MGLFLIYYIKFNHCDHTLKRISKKYLKTTSFGKKVKKPKLLRRSDQQHWRSIKPFKVSKITVCKEIMSNVSKRIR